MQKLITQVTAISKELKPYCTINICLLTFAYSYMSEGTMYITQKAQYQIVFKFYKKYGHHIYFTQNSKAYSLNIGIPTDTG